MSAGINQSSFRLSRNKRTVEDLAPVWETGLEAGQRTAVLTTDAVGLLPFDSYSLPNPSPAGKAVTAMTQVTHFLTANQGYAAARANVTDARPSRRLAVVTCMDPRIDVFAALGLHLGEAHVIRNAGGRVTDDVLRSLALSSHVLGVDTIVVMQHTQCGLAGVTNDELRERTGADLASSRSTITPQPCERTFNSSPIPHTSTQSRRSPASSTTSKVGRSTTLPAGNGRSRSTEQVLHSTLAPLRSPLLSN